MTERNYIVSRAEQHEAYILIKANSKKEAIMLVSKGKGKDMSTTTTFVKELPKNRWKAERLEESFGAEGGVPITPVENSKTYVQVILKTLRNIIWKT